MRFPSCASRGQSKRACKRLPSCACRGQSKRACTPDWCQPGSEQTWLHEAPQLRKTIPALKQELKPALKQDVRRCLVFLARSFSVCRFRNRVRVSRGVTSWAFRGQHNRRASKKEVGGEQAGKTTPRHHHITSPSHHVRALVLVPDCNIHVGFGGSVLDPVACSGCHIKKRTRTSIFACADDH
jgi:hypothetical protein